MFPIQKILLQLVFFLLIYIVLVGIFNVPALQKPIGKQFQQLNLRVANTFFPEVIFRVKKDEELKRPMTYGIKLLFFSKAEVEKAKEDARRRGAKRVNMKAPKVMKIELYTTLLVPILFFWSLCLVGPVSWKTRGIAILVGTLIYLMYYILRTWIGLKGSLGGAGFEVYALGFQGTQFYRTLAQMLGMGINMLVAILLWGILSFKRSNWKNIVEL